MNLRRIVHSQQVLSGGIAELAANTSRTYADLQRELRNVGSLIGTGELAVADSADVISAGSKYFAQASTPVPRRGARHVSRGHCPTLRVVLKRPLAGAW